MKRIQKVYNQEIRELFKKHIEEWKKLKWIWEVLKIPYDTINVWKKKLKKGEELKDGRIWNSTKQRKFKDEELKEYIENNENATLEEIWENFKVTHVAIFLRLKSMNYSFKKKKWNIKKGMKKKEKTIKKN